MKKIIMLIILCGFLSACGSAPKKRTFVFERASNPQREIIQGMMTSDNNKLGIIEGEVYSVKVSSDDYENFYFVGAKVVTTTKEKYIAIWVIMTDNRDEYGMCCALNEYAVSVSVCLDCGKWRRPIFITNEGVSELEEYIISKQ